MGPVFGEKSFERKGGGREVPAGPWLIYLFSRCLSDVLMGALSGLAHITSKQIRVVRRICHLELANKKNWPIKKIGQ